VSAPGLSAPGLSAPGLSAPGRGCGGGSVASARGRDYTPEVRRLIVLVVYGRHRGVGAAPRHTAPTHGADTRRRHTAPTRGADTRRRHAAPTHPSMRKLKRTFKRRPWTAAEENVLLIKCQESRDCSVNGRNVCWPEVVQFFGGTRDYADCKACWRRICDRQMRLSENKSQCRKEPHRPHIPEFARFKAACSRELFDEYGKELVLAPLYKPINFHFLVDWLESDL